MHLKTILIFCSFFLFTETMSEGLNVRQIDFFEALTLSCRYGENIDILKHALYCHEIKETYNDYKLEDGINVRIFKILNFLVKVKKTGDEKRVEKLDINEVEIISNIFRNLDTDNDGLINKEKCNTLVDSISYCVYTGNVKKLDINEVQRISSEFRNLNLDNDSMISMEQCNPLIDSIGCSDSSRGSVVTLNENNNENLKKFLVNMKKEFNDANTTSFTLGEVLIKVLFYKTQLKNTDFDTRYEIHHILQQISQLYSPNAIYHLKTFYNY
ncbi:uncharacterized protein LOC126905983 isoform X1 [Daktulosphaira vitifoliae]|uniref:uncharacterized protein LOC126905983 isoform X1 n=1 Tax=Daktulosphaira vitifoliae TaxID=58002 RepID=UPI0021AAAEA2|nr:uncharacterized protein LOC126905983 isoform X1 [Daktulosphaira vitifoliae]